VDASFRGWLDAGPVPADVRRMASDSRPTWVP
jgi:hypothetical protein